MHKLVFGFCLLILFHPAFAIVDLTDVHLTDYSPGVRGNVTLSLDGNAGNSETRNTSIVSQLQARQSRHTYIFNASYAYGESRDVKNTDKAFAHVRYMRDVGRHHGWELFTQWQRNEFARLESRTLAGGGWRYRNRTRAKKLALVTGAGAFWEKENLDEADTADTLRGNLYLLFNWMLNSHTEWFNTSYYQPSLEHNNDYRILQSSGLTVKLNEAFKLKLSVDLSYDSLPPDGVKDYDVHYHTGLRYQF